MFVDNAGTRRNDRVKAAAIAALFEGALAWALIVGLGMHPVAAVTDQLILVGLAPERVPPPEKKKVVPLRTSDTQKKKAAPKKEGAASPANLHATPTEIVAPPPKPLPVPPPVAAAPIAGVGAAASAGAANVRGPGTGSGGFGNGTGSGNSGNGGGGGGDGGGGPPRLVKGRIKDKDYPRASAEAGYGGTVWVRFAVETNGRATDCSVTRSSGHADIDETTCRLIEDRFRYRPATDRSGRPVRAWLVERHSWSIVRPGEPEPPDDDPDDRD
jgi:periplasmic protein TonB